MGGSTDGSTRIVGTTGGSTADGRRRGVEREVLLWIYGRTCGSTHKLI